MQVWTCHTWCPPWQMSVSSTWPAEAPTPSLSLVQMRLLLMTPRDCCPATSHVFATEYFAACRGWQRVQHGHELCRPAGTLPRGLLCPSESSLLDPIRQFCIAPAAGAPHFSGGEHGSAEPSTRTGLLQTARWCWLSADQRTPAGRAADRLAELPAVVGLLQHVNLFSR